MLLMGTIFWMIAIGMLKPSWHDLVRVLAYRITKIFFILRCSTQLIFNGTWFGQIGRCLLLRFLWFQLFHSIPGFLPLSFFRHAGRLLYVRNIVLSILVTDLCTGHWHMYRRMSWYMIINILISTPKFCSLLDQQFKPFLNKFSTQDEGEQVLDSLYEFRTPRNAILIIASEFICTSKKRLHEINAKNSTQTPSLALDPESILVVCLYSYWLINIIQLTSDLPEVNRVNQSLSTD